MPYQIKKVGDRFQLYNLHNKAFVKVKYKTKQSAINAGKNFMRYRKEKPVVKGNKIVNANKKEKLKK